MALTFNPDNDPRVECARLSESVEELRSEWAASKAANGGVSDPEIKAEFQAAQDELRKARVHWRGVGESAGSRQFVSIQHHTPDPEPI